MALTCSVPPLSNNFNVVKKNTFNKLSVFVLELSQEQNLVKSMDFAETELVAETWVYLKHLMLLSFQEDFEQPSEFLHFFQLELNSFTPMEILMLYSQYLYSLIEFTVKNKYSFTLNKDVRMYSYK